MLNVFHILTAFIYSAEMYHGPPLCQAQFTAVNTVDTGDNREGPCSHSTSILQHGYLSQQYWHLEPSKYIYMYTHTHIYIYIYFMFICIYTHMYLYIYFFATPVSFIFICIYTHMYLYIYFLATPVSFIFICIYTHMYLHIYIYILATPVSCGKLFFQNTSQIPLFHAPSMQHHLLLRIRE